MTISATTQGLRPGVCTSTSRPSSPFDGQVIYETDTNRVAVWDNTAWTYLTGANFVEWTAYTPTWTNLTVGNGSQEFRYIQIGKLVTVSGRFTFGSTTSVTSSPIKLSLPVTARTPTLTNAGQGLGGGTFTDAGSSLYAAVVVYDTTTRVGLCVYGTGGTFATVTDTSSSNPFVWANTDEIGITFSYEAA